MTDVTLEKNLRGFDFSELSKVKKSLLADLLRAHRADRDKESFGGLMSDEELDYVAAAGNPNVDPKPKKV